MQASITRFFKAVPTPNKKDQADSTQHVANKNETSGAVENATAGSQEEPSNIDETNTPQIENTSPEPRTPKRPSEHITQTPKRKALLTSEGTPSKRMDIVRKVISDGASALHENIGASWFTALRSEFEKPYFKKLSDFVSHQRKINNVFPSPEKVYTWTFHHNIRDTRVVILGQDPYHGPNQAHGLSFSVQSGVKHPPSLANIFQELQDDIPGFDRPESGDLTGWTKQGVLMLNTCLTVNQGQAFSHQGKGWETFTDAVISWISKNAVHKVVFILWGRPAQKKASLIDKRHFILKCAHPSPLSAHSGFFGCNHFSRTNEFLSCQKLAKIDWKAL